MAGGKIWEVGKGPRDQTGAWTQMLADAQGPWLVVHKTGTCKPQHGTYWYKILGQIPPPRWGLKAQGTWYGRGAREQVCEIAKCGGISESPRFLNKPHYPNPLRVYFSPVTVPVLNIIQFLIRFGNYSNLSY